LTPGGKGTNQAAAAAKLGSSVTMVGRVGDDTFGPVLVANLERLGADTQHVTVDPQASTGTAIVIVDAEGENCIVVSAGANGCTSKEDVDRAVSLLQQAQSVFQELCSHARYAAYKATAGLHARRRSMM